MTAGYAQVEGSYIFPVLITVSVCLKFNFTQNKVLLMLRALASRTVAGKSTARSIFKMSRQKGRVGFPRCNLGHGKRPRYSASPLFENTRARWRASFDPKYDQGSR